MGIYLKIAARNLLRARRRSLFLSVALALVTSLLVMLLSLSQGMTESMIRATSLVSGHVNVHGFLKLSPGSVAPLITDLAEIRRLVEENVEGVEAVVDRAHAWVKVVSETGSTMTSISGLDPAQEGLFIRRISLAPQREYKEGGSDEVKGDRSRIGAPGTIVLFASQAKRLGVDVGDQVTVTAETPGRGMANSADLTVVAVARDQGMMSHFVTFASKQTAQQLYQLKESVSGSIMVYLKDIRQTAAVRARLADVLEAHGHTVLEPSGNPSWMAHETLSGEAWTGQRYDVNTWEDEAHFAKWTIAGFDGVTFFLIGILMVIIVVGIMNTMWMSVRERTGEVGTLRAIGMRRRRVLLMFVTEAVLLGLAATVVGSLAGAAIAYALNASAISVPWDAARAILMSDTLHMVVRSDQIVRAIVTFTAVAAFSALIPASRAARMPPVTAIQHVE